MKFLFCFIMKQFQLNQTTTLQKKRNSVKACLYSKPLTSVGHLLLCTSHFFGSFCRVLDLIEIFIKKQASSPFVLVCESMSLFFIFLDFSDFFGSNFSNFHSKLAFGLVSCYHNLLLRRSDNQEFHGNATFQNCYCTMS